MIELHDIKKSYTLGSQVVHALRGVSLSWGPGELCAITGRSGSGKSTLLHVIGSLDRPSSGRVLVGGVDLSRLSDHEASRFRNRAVGFVFQASHLLPEFSALENVMMPGMIAGIAHGPLKARALSLLGKVGLDHRVDHRPSELSGGEQQRVAIARALVMAPKVLLADEPTGNLDKQTSETIQELLLTICREQDLTMLLVTHDPALAERLPRRVVMEDGLVRDAGGPA